MENQLTSISFESVVRAPFSDGAIVRNDFPGFREDYLAIHCLIRQYQPERFMEIGTSSGLGTNVICNAMRIRRWEIWKRTHSPQGRPMVYSIDVPPGTDPTIIYPDAEDGHPRKAGASCKYPYVQLYGDSTAFLFSEYYPLDGWFIDGKHNYDYASADTTQALKSSPKLIIWHDMQIEGVEMAVLEVMSREKQYRVFRVEQSRVAFAVKE